MILDSSAPIEPMHVYDWLNLLPSNPAERDAKEWLIRFLRPTIDKTDGWLEHYRVSVKWRYTIYLFWRFTSRRCLA